MERGVHYLVTSQNPDGSWSETLVTGTGFPRVFYLKYDMYRNNWPLMALARYAVEVLATDESEIGSGAVCSAHLDPALQPTQEAAFSSLISGFASLPVFVLLKDLLTKLNHG